jgi:2-polyprenyl-3-methyl-5-hydroxy-6-metoxy-1,4-benzoquinol methylase
MALDLRALNAARVFAGMFRRVFAPGPEDPFQRFKSGYHKLSAEQIKRDMDRRYETGDAYPNPAIWIHAHHRDLEDAFAELVGEASVGADILEIGCGSGGVAAHRLPGARRILATDLSDAALEIARDFFRERRPEVEFVQSGAEHIDCPDDSFDIAISKEVIEHLRHPELLVQQAFRLLRPGGMFVISSPNRDSLHLRINRLFGRPDFMSAGDHIRELSYDEMMAMLAEAGFVHDQSVGATLLPYHGVKGVFPDEIRNAEDHDEEFVRMMQILGRRAGPEYAFCYVIKCHKPLHPQEPGGPDQSAAAPDIAEA